MNQSKVNDPRFWKKWYESGAVSGIIKNSCEIAKGNQSVKEVLTNDFTIHVVDETIGNLTQRHFTPANPWLKTVLLEFCGRICRIILTSPKVTFPDFSPEWRDEISEKCFDILNLKKLIAREKMQIFSQLGRISSFLTLGENQCMLPWSLTKIANTVACVAYVVKNGLPPAILKQSDEEVQEYLLTIAMKRLTKNPDGAIILDPNQDQAEMISEIILLVNPPDITDILSQTVR